MSDTTVPAAGKTRPEGASTSASAEEEPTPPRPAAGRRLEYDGAAGPIAKIAVSNALLTLATLGAYRFWAKRMLRHSVRLSR